LFGSSLRANAQTVTDSQSFLVSCLQKHLEFCLSEGIYV
jgi:hypothetical protein